ncbi:MAG: lysophospholipid acyltransferase family protein, partial [Dehalococcoidia bacterium]
QSTQRNYARVLGVPPDSERVQRLTRRTFRHFGRYIVELLHVQGWGLEKVRHLVTIQGQEHVEEALSHGRGIIFVSGHMGSIEVASTLVLLRGYKVTSVTEPLQPGFLMDWLLSSRARVGVTLLPVMNSGRRLLRALRRKEMVALVLDVGVRENGGVLVRFFGQPTYFPGGPARLARLSGAPILFGLALRQPNNRFTAHVSPPIFADREADAEEDVARTTQRLVEIFEAFVRRFPDQWYPFRDMWPEE